MNKWDIIKLKAFCIAKETINKRTTHIVGENICKIYNWQLINLQNIQAACSPIPKKKKKKHTTQSKNRRPK